jgi:hypothetical protein
MSTIPSRWGPLPDNVSIWEDLITCDVHVLIRGRDEAVEVVIKRDVPWVYDRIEMNEVIRTEMRRLFEQERKLDAVTAKLTS